ncbi:putative membrane protein YozB [Sporosarcina luteola]|uniref:Putative membrane protein YozB n=2 Tax=Sporosarcina luteola TaxID=582850 RepID=A0A511Z571_9BACL|nr:putative membrane protein YozB [Sporosarcina luteola]
MLEGMFFMSQIMESGKPFKKRNYKPAIIILSIVLIGIIGLLSGKRGAEEFDAFDVTILPMLNAIFNSFTFIFLVAALIAIKKRNINVHRKFIYAAFFTTSLFLVTYVSYHYLAASTPYGGEGILAGIYYFVLITHIVLAAAIVPLALTSVARAWNREHDRHRKIVRWTMPIWLYVSFTGVLVYILISPYY